MRCYMITPGNGIDSLTLIDCPTPEPGPGQLLVALKAVSLNYRDLLIADGLYRGGGASGIVTLSDGAGEVVGIGEGCSRFTEIGRASCRERVCSDGLITGGAVYVKTKNKKQEI